MQIDRRALSAHKLYGQQGIGALYVRRGNRRVRLAPVLYDAGREQGLRSKTQNAPGIVGLGMAAESVRREMVEQAARKLLSGVC